MNVHSQGSTWRKWDLHVHLPGTTLSDGYAKTNGKSDWDRFCTAIENSDVAVIGITDYFSLDGTLDLISHFRAQYPDSNKVLIPNLELRLNEAVNRAGEEVNIHLLFPENLSSETAQRFMTYLKTEVSVDGRELSCNELIHESQYASATVTRSAIQAAIRATYGAETDREDNLLIIASCKGDGIRPLRGALRKSNLTDAIDQLSDGFFGNATSSEWFLNTSRLENPETFIPQKPVFGGSDAHSFDALSERLGKNIEQSDQRGEITWIKADPSYSGLCQTLIEPRDRVRLQPTRPDAKEPYQVISRVRFPGSSDFPGEIVFNPNLTSIIGSRSSGKSALLAYISHAIDPGYTIEQQMATGQYPRQDMTGPAAGKTWTEVQDIVCEVEWEDPEVRHGKVIYIPQNSLYALSGRPGEITAKIKPALYRLNPDFELAHKKALDSVASLNSSIDRSVGKWFDLRSRIQDAKAHVQDLGDMEAISTQKKSLILEVDEIRKQSSLTAEETEQYQVVLDRLAAIESRINTTGNAVKAVEPYIDTTEDGSSRATGDLSAEVRINKPVEDLPTSLAEELQRLCQDSQRALQASIDEAVVLFHEKEAAELLRLCESAEAINTDNAGLIAKNAQNVELENRLQRVKKQEALLAQIQKQEDALEMLLKEQESELEAVTAATSDRRAHLLNLKSDFDVDLPKLEDIELGMEIGIDSERVDALSQDFNQRSNVYIDKQTGLLDLAMVRDNVGDFLEALASSRQKIKQGRLPREVAASVLQITEEIRLLAHLDGDRIGGFASSSMTPGKQALFALTLILNQSQESWPLLIDQPEDDLDSRSIYQHIVPYLNKRKSGRQIIMVTHNANLVLGADSELVIVANRHGEDRKNYRARMFDYLGGSLEHSLPKRPHDLVLSTCGVREHACEILDGGADAFRKRKEKYRV